MHERRRPQLRRMTCVAVTRQASKSYTATWDTTKNLLNSVVHGSHRNSHTWSRRRHRRIGRPGHIQRYPHNRRYLKNTHANWLQMTLHMWRSTSGCSCVYLCRWGYRNTQASTSRTVQSYVTSHHCTYCYHSGCHWSQRYSRICSCRPGPHRFHWRKGCSRIRWYLKAAACSRQLRSSNHDKMSWVHFAL